MQGVWVGRDRARLIKLDQAASQTEPEPESESESESVPDRQTPKLNRKSKRQSRYQRWHYLYDDQRPDWVDLRRPMMARARAVM